MSIQGNASARSGSRAANSAIQVLDLASVIDEGRMNGFRYVVLFLILLAMFADGYDTVSISYAAPIIAAKWHLSQGAMGSVFSAGLVGLIVGGAIMGTLGDWIGRRNAILMSTVLLGLFSLCTVLATDLRSLLIWRFLTGLGIGSIAPLCLVMANEYAPRRLRTTVPVVLFVSLSVVGTAACGAISVFLVPVHGWKSLFYVGGAIPLIVVLLLLFFLPESPKFLYVKWPDSSRLKKIVRRLDPAISDTKTLQFIWSGENQSKRALPFHLIFADRRALSTLFLWIALFVGQLVAIGFTLWLPSLLHGVGFSPTGIAVTILTTAVAGCLGGLLVTRCIDRFGVAVLAGLPLLGTFIVLVISFSESVQRLLFLAIVAAGFSIQGTLQGIMAVAPALYPTAIRSAGVGLAVFLSRFGSILGPLLLGLLLSHDASLKSVFQALAAPLLITALATFFLGKLAQRNFAATQAVAVRETLRPGALAQPAIIDEERP